MNPSQAQPHNPSDPHANQPILHAGPTPQQAAGVLLLIHGRGATAQSILLLYNNLALDRLAALAPQAAGNSWYPHSFLAPLQANQPYLDSALRRLDSLLADLLAHGIPSRRIAILGFSQGACLTLEYAAQHPRRYGAILGLTGGLIGPPGAPHHYPGSLDATPVFLASADPDPHVPFDRVQETAAVLANMNATVELRRYPGMPHTINEDELNACRTLLQREIVNQTDSAISQTRPRSQS